MTVTSSWPGSGVRGRPSASWRGAPPASPTATPSPTAPRPQRGRHHGGRPQGGPDGEKGEEEHAERIDRPLDAGRRRLHGDLLADLLAEDRGRRRAFDAAETADDALHGVQPGAALRAGRAVIINLADLRIPELGVEVRGELLSGYVAIHGFFSRRTRSCSRPRAMRERTVPTRTPSTSAISS